MSFLEINPHHRAFLEAQRLTRCEQFLALPAVIISGHPERNVARVTIGSKAEAMPAFLKREHRVRCRDRLANAWAGFGLVSKSRREGQVLQLLREADVGCPDWMAVGEDDQGRAFLLLREVEGAVELRCHLRKQAPAARRCFARQLGETLARMHRAGFDHPDLYSKHVLVDPRSEQIYVLDWQRTQRRRRIRLAHRCRDLAALDATLSETLASPRDRFACLRAYVESSEMSGDAHAYVCRMMNGIRQRSRHLLSKRHVREARRELPPMGTQSVIWLDGEALCVTPAFWDELEGCLPDWLKLDAGEKRRAALQHQVVPLSCGRRGLLVRRRENVPWRWLWQGLRRRPLLSPELRQAGELFRLERHGIPAPRLLAFGQRRPWPWRTESFLLTEMTSAESGGQS